MQGFLEKQQDSKLLKTFRRLWFQQRGDNLFYYRSVDDKVKRKNSVDLSWSVLLIALAQNPINYVPLNLLEAPVKLTVRLSARSSLLFLFVRVFNEIAQPGSQNRFELRVRGKDDDHAHERVFRLRAPKLVSARVHGVGFAEIIFDRFFARSADEAKRWITELNNLLLEQALAAKNVRRCAFCIWFLGALRLSVCLLTANDDRPSKRHAHHNSCRRAWRRVTTTTAATPATTIVAGAVVRKHIAVGARCRTLRRSNCSRSWRPLTTRSRDSPLLSAPPLRPYWRRPTPTSTAPRPTCGASTASAAHSRAKTIRCDTLIE